MRCVWRAISGFFADVSLIAEKVEGVSFLEWLMQCISSLPPAFTRAEGQFGPRCASSLSHLCPTAEAAVAPGPKGPGPWAAEIDQPSEHTSSLARFRAGVQSPVSTAQSLAGAVFQARCEIRDFQSGSPQVMTLSSDGSCVALASADDYKQRDPLLQCIVLDEDGEEELFEVQPSLAYLVESVALDSDRRLVFAGDRDRIKSYSWEDDLEPVHTLIFCLISPLQIQERCRSYHSPSVRQVRAGRRGRQRKLSYAMSMNCGLFIIYLLLP